MKREIGTELLDWKNRQNRKPLIMRGAHQVGKTYSIEKFARSHFANFVKINLLGLAGSSLTRQSMI